MLTFGSALSDYARAPEDTDYLRSALTEATAGTTTITGGLTLGSMIAVGTSANKLAAGMQAVDTDNLPMIWAGAEAASDAGITGAKFRVKADGTTVMSNAKILGGTSGSDGMVMNDGAITFGKLTGETINAADKKTEITSAAWTSISQALQKGQANAVKGTLTASTAFSPSFDYNQPAHNEADLRSSLSYKTLQSFTVPTTATAGTIKFTPSGTVKVAASSAPASSLKATNYTNSVTASIGIYIYKNGHNVATLLSESDSTNKADSQSTVVPVATASISKTYSVSTTAVSATFSPGDSFSIVASTYYTAHIWVNINSTGYISVRGACTITPSVSVTYDSSDINYNNTYFATGMFLSSSSSRYFCVVPNAAAVFQVSSGKTASSAALLKFGTSGLLQSLDGGKQFYRANPLVLVVRLTYANSSMKAAALYNPLGKTVSVTRTDTGRYTVTHNLGHTYYTVMGSGRQSGNSYTLYVTVVTIGTNIVLIRTSDDSSLNDLSEAELSFFDYKTY